jgi:PAS domain S-box-containing protein
MESRESLDLDFLIVTRRGETRWIAHACSPVYSDDGRMIGRRVSNRDITERKQGEEQLRKLSRAVEQSPAMIVITDVAGSIEYVNPKFTEVTGYSFEEAIGQNPRILKSGEMAPEEYTRLWNIITAGGEWRGEFHNKKKSGELFWESVSISPVFDEHNNITHFVAVKLRSLSASGSRPNSATVKRA